MSNCDEQQVDEHTVSIRQQVENSSEKINKFIKIQIDDVTNPRRQYGRSLQVETTLEFLHVCLYQSTCNSRYVDDLTSRMDTNFNQHDGNKDVRLNRNRSVRSKNKPGRNNLFYGNQTRTEPRIPPNSHPPACFKSNPWMPFCFNQPPPVVQPIQRTIPPPSIINNFNQSPPPMMQNVMRNQSMNQYSPNIPPVVNFPVMASRPRVFPNPGIKNLPASRSNPQVLPKRVKKIPSPPVPMVIPQKTRFILGNRRRNFANERDQISRSDKEKKDLILDRLGELISLLDPPSDISRRCSASNLGRVEEDRYPVVDKKAQRLQRFSQPSESSGISECSSVSTSVDGSFDQGIANNTSSEIDDEYLRDYFQGIEEQKRKREEVLKHKLIIMKRNSTEESLPVNATEVETTDKQKPDIDTEPMNVNTREQDNNNEKPKEAEAPNFNVSFPTDNLILNKWKSRSMEDLRVLRTKLTVSVPPEFIPNRPNLQDSVENKTRRIVRRKFPLIALKTKVDNKIKRSRKKFKKNSAGIKNLKKKQAGRPKKASLEKGLIEPDKMFPVVVLEKMAELDFQPKKRKYIKKTCTCDEDAQTSNWQKDESFKLDSQLVCYCKEANVKNCTVVLEKLSEDFLLLLKKN